MKSEYTLPILIIGGGVAGMAAAMHLAQADKTVIILEKEAAVGGKVWHINCKQIKGKCTHCGACAVYELIQQVNKHPLVECLTRQQVTSIKKVMERVEITCRGSQGNLSLSGAAAIIATGLKPFPAEERHETGYGSIPRVITALELERRARERGTFSFLGRKPRLAIVHCVGSRQGYCSRVCCLYGAKISRLLVEALPEATIEAYCLDKQHYRSEYEADWPPEVKVAAVMPGRIYRNPEGDCVIRAEEPGHGVLVEREYDWVILCTGLVPDPDTVLLGLGAGMNLDKYGFLNDHTGPDLICAAGGTTAPLSFFECIESGISAAGELLKVLG